MLCWTTAREASCLAPAVPCHMALTFTIFLYCPCPLPTPETRTMVPSVQSVRERATLGQAAQVGWGSRPGKAATNPRPLEPAQSATSSAVSPCFLSSICKLPGKSLIGLGCLGQG